MKKRLNRKISEYFEVTVENSSQRILNTLSEQKQKQLWTDFFLSDGIDFKGINIKDNRLEIIRTPSMLNPFRAMGRITFDLSETNNKVTVKCRILPFDGMFLITLAGYFIFVTLWTIVCFIMLWGDLKALLLIISGWVVFGLILYFGLVYTKSELRNYSKRIIRELMIEE